MTNGIAEKASKPRTRTSMVSKSTCVGVLKATAKGSLKNKVNSRKATVAKATLKKAVEISFLSSFSFSAKRKKVVSIPWVKRTVIIPATE
jgi:hypothetical protein